jgi:hypothetical protein
MRCRSGIALVSSPLSEILELSEERLMLEQRLSTVKARLEELAGNEETMRGHYTDDHLGGEKFIPTPRDEDQE